MDQEIRILHNSDLNDFDIPYDELSKQNTEDDKLQDDNEERTYGFTTGSESNDQKPILMIGAGVIVAIFLVSCCVLAGGSQKVSPKQKQA